MAHEDQYWLKSRAEKKAIVLVHGTCSSIKLWNKRGSPLKKAMCDEFGEANVFLVSLVGPQFA
jgi:hypothetical protein